MVITKPDNFIKFYHQTSNVDCQILTNDHQTIPKLFLKNIEVGVLTSHYSVMMMEAAIIDNTFFIYDGTNQY